MRLYWVRVRNTIKQFPHIMGGSKVRLGGLFYQTPPNLAPQNYGTNIFETNKTILKTQNNG